jgi:hypothetical protein
MTLAEEPSRNIDELKRLVITALDRSGVLSELRSTVKLHVARAINEDPQGVMCHQKNEKFSRLMSAEKGQLLTELVVEFLRFYDLKDTLAMLVMEGSLPKLRPSENEIAAQCGLRGSHQDLSLLEQLLEPARAAATSSSSSPDSTSSPVNKSLEGEMTKMRNISQEIERISLGSTNRFVQDEEDAYDQDDFDSAPSLTAREDVTPVSRIKRNSFVAEDEVLFASRESLKELGVAPSRLFPVEDCDRVEPFESS